MIALSLFDGMGCGYQSLKQAGIPVTGYLASEIDKYAIKICKKNHPDVIQIGCVTQVKDLIRCGVIGHVDLLLGGSPCQGFSFAGKQLAFNDPRSQLFFEYIEIMRLLKEINPDLKYLLENVRMKKDYLDIITQYMGVEPHFINSALVSAQNRQRYYWYNWEAPEPEDQGLVLADIVEDGEVDREKSRAIISSIGRTTKREYFKKNQGQMVAIEQRGRGNNKGGIKALDGKCPALTASRWEQNNKLIKLGNVYSIEGEGSKVCIDIGRITDMKGHDYNKRVYSPLGESSCLNTGSGGNLEPKIAIDEVKWRKLTPIECERLQTLPDDYTEDVSNTQRYKMLGNGWTVSVIEHILRSLNAKHP